MELFFSGLFVGSIVGFYLAAKFGPGEPQKLIVLERGDDGKLHRVPDVSRETMQPYTGPPLLPYVVRDDGLIEYADGKLEDPLGRRTPDLVMHIEDRST